jgi:hypothetical protein
MALGSAIELRRQGRSQTPFGNEETEEFFAALLEVREDSLGLLLNKSSERLIF